MELANSLDRFFVAHDMDYAAKYPDGAMAMKLSESLYNGRTDYIKDMLACVDRNELSVSKYMLARQAPYK